MLNDVRDLTKAAVDVLELLAAISGIALLALAAFSLLLATFRVAVRGRVFALPFSGNDDRRVDLTKLFVRRLTTMEQEWISLAARVDDVRKEVNARVKQHVSEVNDATPFAKGSLLNEPRLPDKKVVATSSPRTSGDELSADVVQLGGVGSIENADLGVISLAGVSFSPRDILALLRAAPGALARRRLDGSIITLGGGTFLFTVGYEERDLIGRRRRRTETAEIKDEAWLNAVEDLAFRLEKERVYLMRDRRRWLRKLRGKRSETVRSAVVEAESWAACRSFLVAYEAHLNHYRDGSAGERERALASYNEALSVQPEFPRAAYNRGALLYNRYLPKANEQAIADFKLATKTQDPSLKPLALAGLAIAHCQAIQRFEKPPSTHKPPARASAQAAFRLAPELVEAAFAKAWVRQVDKQWTEAMAEYDSVVALPGDSGAERRIKSFALNNAGWILLSIDMDEDDARERAERLLWQALELYPNKATYANLADLARLCDRPDDAVTLYRAALTLDPSYVNALIDLAVVEVHLAMAAAQRGDGDESKAKLEAARGHADEADKLASEDPDFAKSLREPFEAAWAAAHPPKRRRRRSLRRSK
jgi:tetratricopeptide (TPR) repeat protein